MRADFPEFYRPSEEEYSDLFEKAIIVLDTNVLLDAYRTPDIGRDGFLTTLEELRGRIWIPHHVALEFQSNRLNVISAQLREIDSTLNESEIALTKVNQSIDTLRLDERKIGIDPTPIRSAIESARTLLVDAVEKARSAQIEVTHDDHIRDRLDSILQGRVGAHPASQAVLDEIYKEAERRYKLSIPPGFKDNQKLDDQNNTYVANGFIYQRRFGDYLVWRQTLDYVKETQWQSVIFVTSERKEDWWLKRDGKTLGPLPELVAEMRRETGAKAFWLYRNHEFLNQARKHFEAKVSQKAIEQLQQIADTPNFHKLPDMPAQLRPSLELPQHEIDENAVRAWLEGTGNSTFTVSGAVRPYHFLTENLEDGIAGWIVTRLGGPTSLEEFDVVAVARAMDQAAWGKDDLGLHRGGVIVLVPFFLVRPGNEGRWNTLKRTIAAMARNIPIDRAYIGYVEGAHFKRLWTYET